MYKWDHAKQSVQAKWRAHWFSIHPPEVAEYSWNYLFTGGKEIRPTLFCELWHYLDPGTPINAELAFAIECVHVASTILDDTPWMDNAPTRRGRSTLHIQFSPKKALLLTYSLMDMVRTIWSAHCPAHVPTTVWHTLLQTSLQRLSIGQYYDMEKKGTLLELASLKTGVLFELVAETVALHLTLDTEYWRRWGNYLGVLFQWMDDWHDQEEDRIQESRNAFNEDYQTTLEKYTAIWSHIETGIGPQWFQTPFGEFMRTYFTKSLSIPQYASQSQRTLSSKLAIPSLPHLPPLLSLLPDEIPYHRLETLPYPLPFTLPHPLPQLTGKEILQQLFRASNEFFTIPSLRTNFWDIDESKWEEVEEIKHLMEQQRSYLPTYSPQ
jgi:geranylgeranyl pyrophosphate synthase